MTPIAAVVFDIGGVLVDWNPRHLYRTLFTNDAAMEEFLATICTQEWNEAQDRGRPWDDAVASLSVRFPASADLIAAYHHRWLETIRAPIDGSVAVLAEVRARGMPVYSITNFSAEKLLLAQERYPFLRDFDIMIVSGVEKILKPDPAIYQALLNRAPFSAAQMLFIDDVAVNVAAAQAMGMPAVRFCGVEGLRADLRRYGVLP